MPNGQSKRRIAWFGPRKGGLGDLYDRLVDDRENTVTYACAASCPQSEQLAPICDTPVDRIIFSCPGRLDYPLDAIAWLSQHCPHIPFAIALGPWWEGARRTGLSSVGHVALPWHRWWDGWTLWIEGSHPELFGPCITPPTYHASWALRAERPIRPKETAPTLGIVANCHVTAQAWKIACEAIDFDALAMPITEFEQDSPKNLDWIIWDDTCLNSTTGQTVSEAGVSFFRTTRRRYPAAILCAAITIVRWEDWVQLKRAGADELLSKPTTGLSLHRLTRSHEQLSREK